MAAAATVVRKVLRVPRARRIPLPGLADDVGVGDAAAGEDGGSDGMGGHEVEAGGVVEAGSSGLDDEGGDAAAAGVGVGFGEDGVGVGVAGLADEFLGAVDDATHRPRRWRWCAWT